MKQNYYAVIPADVRYDRRLKPIERLLYGEITALTNKEGYCFATNHYFSQLYECTTRAIQMYLNHLQKCGYITILVENKNNRKIFLLAADEGVRKNFQGGTKELSGGTKELSGGYERIFVPYNNEYNNTNNNPPISPHEKNEDWKAAWEAFIEMRKKKKSPLTDRAKKLILNKLEPYGKNEQIEMLNEAIIHNWLSVYPRDPPKSKKENTWEGVTRL